MFPIIAIAAFFLLGIAFFTFGKDDFGITRLKEDPNNSSTEEKEILSPTSYPEQESIS